ncbi:hypothetical protein HDK64DRAFT_109523 [Phyllosticta capitalensis]
MDNVVSSRRRKARRLHALLSPVLSQTSLKVLQVCPCFTCAAAHDEAELSQQLQIRKHGYTIKSSKNLQASSSSPPQMTSFQFNPHSQQQRRFCVPRIPGGADPPAPRSPSPLEQFSFLSNTMSELLVPLTVAFAERCLEPLSLLQLPSRPSRPSPLATSKRRPQATHQHEPFAMRPSTVGQKTTSKFCAVYSPNP